MSKKCTPLWREAHFQVKVHKTHKVRTTFGSSDVEKVDAVVARSTFPSQNVQKKHMFTPLLEVEMSKKCTPLWREAHVQVKMYKTPHVHTTFWSWDVEKVHAVVARSTCPSQNVQSTTCSRHFWRFGCWKSARRCGAKHISMSKCQKQQGFQPLLAVHAVVARSTCRSQNVKSTRGSDHCWRFRCRFAWQAQGIVHLVKSGFCSIFNYHHHYTTLHSNTLHYTTTTYRTTPSLHSTTHPTTLRSTTLHCTQLHSITLYYITLHYTTLHNTTTATTQLHSTTLHYTKLHYTTLHYTTLHSITLHYTTLHSTTLQLQLQLQLHSTTINYTTLLTLHHTTFHYTTLQYTTLQWMTLHHR